MEEKMRLQQVNDEYVRYFPKAGETGHERPRYISILFTILVVIELTFIYIGFYYARHVYPNDRLSDLIFDLVLNSMSTIVFFFIPFMLLLILGSLQRMMLQKDQRHSQKQAISIILLFLVPLIPFSIFFEIPFVSFGGGIIITIFFLYVIHGNPDLAEMKFWNILSGLTFILSLVSPVYFLLFY
jgi:hypothetical protein